MSGTVISTAQPQTGNFYCQQCGCTFANAHYDNCPALTPEPRPAPPTEQDIRRIVREELVACACRRCTCQPADPARDRTGE